MCSSEGTLIKTIVEGAELNVCNKCSKFGRVIGTIEETKVTESKSKKINAPKKETLQIIIGDYAEKIKIRRESLDLTQEQFAKKINEKESIIQKIESKHYEPSIDLAKKIEHFLNIRLIEDYEEKHKKMKYEKSEKFTIGDFIKTKNK